MKCGLFTGSLFKNKNQSVQKIIKDIKMNKYFYFMVLCTLVLGIFATSCKTDETSQLMEENGLSKAINNFISDDIFNILDSLGMPVHTGGEPVNVEGAFLVSKAVLLASNFPDDSVGYEFEEIKISFSGQNTKELTLTAEFTQDSSETECYESYISGEGNDFSVFSKSKTFDSTGKDSAFSAQVYSGTWSSEGINDLYMAVVMLDNHGNPQKSYLDVGNARLVFDKDGLSEKIDEKF
jgi:hypothetical protein